MPGFLGTIFEDLKKGIRIDTTAAQQDLVNAIPPDLVDRAQPTVSRLLGVTQAKNQTLLVLAGIGLMLAAVLWITRTHPARAA